MVQIKLFLNLYLAKLLDQNHSFYITFFGFLEYVLTLFVRKF